MEKIAYYVGGDYEVYLNTQKSEGLLITSCLHDACSITLLGVSDIKVFTTLFGEYEYSADADTRMIAFNRILSTIERSNTIIDDRYRVDVLNAFVHKGVDGAKEKIEQVKA